MAHGYKTHQQVTREHGGGDWNENVEQLGPENEALKKAGGIVGASDVKNGSGSPTEGDGGNEQSE